MLKMEDMDYKKVSNKIKEYEKEIESLEQRLQDISSEKEKLSDSIKKEAYDTCMSLVGNRIKKVCDDREVIYYHIAKFIKIENLVEAGYFLCTFTGSRYEFYDGQVSIFTDCTICLSFPELCSYETVGHRELSSLLAKTLDIMPAGKLGEEEKKKLITRFEILRTMYDNGSDSNKSFSKYALENWDKVDMNYFDTIG